MLLERHRRRLVLDQIAIAFSLGPSARLDGSAGRGVLAQPQRFRIDRIDLRDPIVDLHLLVALAQLVIKPAELMEDFRVARFVFEQSLEREDADLRPARRHGRLFQDEVGLAIVRFILQDFLDQLHRALRIFLQLALRFHDRESRRGNIEECLLRGLLPRYFRPAQKLPAREKFRLLFQDSLQKRNRVTEIA